MPQRVAETFGGDTDARVVSRPDATRTQHDVGLLWRVVARCVRRPDVQLCHPDDHRGLGAVARRSRAHRHGDPLDLLARRLVFRDARRPLRPGEDAADHDPVVFGLHVSVRLRPEFRAAVHPARAARLRLWRRMGGGRGVDGRSHPRQVPRPRRRPGADRLGDRLGRLGPGLHRDLLAPAGGARLARAVRGRPLPGGLRVLDPPPYRGAGHLPDPAPRPPAGRLVAPVLGLPRPASLGDGQDVADGRRRPGRRLCDRHLDADLSAHGAAFLGDRDRRLSPGADPRRPVRVSARLLSQRRDRPQVDLSVVGDSLVRLHPLLHVRADGRHRAVVRRAPAVHRCC